MSSIYEIESKLNGLLPGSHTSVADPKIEALTRELIAEGKSTTERTSSYTHSVCHLFEQYGWGNGPSYLNSAALLPVAGELVDFTLKKALDAGEFNCVSRIVHPIAKLNLAHLERDSGIFVFKPKIMTNAEFIKNYSKSEDLSDQKWLADFCKSQNVGEFFPIYVQALRKEKGLGTLTDTKVVPGVFIDVEGTMITFDRCGDLDKNGDREYIYKRLPTTQEYALRKLQEVIPVTVFTGGDIKDIRKNLKSAGVDKKLCKVQPKKEFLGRTLETCIDDTIPTMQGFRAKTHYTSGQQAWDKEYSG